MKRMKKKYYYILIGVIIGALIISADCLFLGCKSIWELTAPKKEPVYATFCQKEISDYWLTHHCSICNENTGICSAFIPDTRENNNYFIFNMTNGIQIVDQTKTLNARFGNGLIAMCSWIGIPPEYVNACYNTSVIEKISEEKVNAT